MDGERRIRCRGEACKGGIQSRVYLEWRTQTRVLRTDVYARVGAEEGDAENSVLRMGCHGRGAEDGVKRTGC